MYEFERPPHLVFDGPSSIQSARIRQLHDYWRSKCRNDRPPPRNAIEPGDIRPLLPHLILAELTPEPFRILYRLVGTAIAKAHKEDFTGRDHAEVESLRGAGIEDAYRNTLKSGQPMFGRTGLYAGDHSWIGFEYAILPLSDDGVLVNKCLAIECTGAAEQQAWAEGAAGRPAPEEPRQGR